MISADQARPIRELPTAYLYRQSGTQRPPGCGCNAPKNFEIITATRHHRNRQREIESSSFLCQRPLQPLILQRLQMMADRRRDKRSDDGRLDAKNNERRDSARSGSSGQRSFPTQQRQ